VVSLYDAYSGRNLGIQYQTNQNSLSIRGLPIGQPVEVVVQVGGVRRRRRRRRWACC
jgi:hypothetical protein